MEKKEEEELERLAKEEQERIERLAKEEQERLEKLSKKNAYGLLRGSVIKKTRIFAVVKKRRKKRDMWKSTDWAKDYLLRKAESIKPNDILRFGVKVVSRHGTRNIKYITSKMHGWLLEGRIRGHYNEKLKKENNLKMQQPKSTVSTEVVSCCEKLTEEKKYLLGVGGGSIIKRVLKKNK